MKKNYFIGLAVLAFFGALLTGCGNGTPKQQDAQAAESEAMEVDDLLAGAESLAGQTVTIEGVCTHICQHGGGKIFLMGSDDTQTIRVDAGEKVGKFPTETVNSLVRVTGTLEEQRIDEAFLSQWEAEAKAAGECEHEGGAGCESDQKARGEAPASNLQERIDNFRKRIAEREQAEGKAYLSFYSITADSYEIR